MGANHPSATNNYASCQQTPSALIFTLSLLFPRFKNHEGSKKHRENVARLKEVMLEEEENLNGGPDSEDATNGVQGSGESGQPSSLATVRISA